MLSNVMALGVLPMPSNSSSARLQTTTVRLPKRLYEEDRLVVKKRATEATSLNEPLVSALRDKLKQLRRA